MLKIHDSREKRKERTDTDTDTDTDNRGNVTDTGKSLALDELLCGQVLMKAQPHGMDSMQHTYVVAQDIHTIVHIVQLLAPP